MAIFDVADEEILIDTFFEDDDINISIIDADIFSWLINRKWAEIRWLRRLRFSFSFWNTPEMTFQVMPEIFQPDDVCFSSAVKHWRHFLRNISFRSRAAVPMRWQMSRHGRRYYFRKTFSWLFRRIISTTLFSSTKSHTLSSAGFHVTLSLIIDDINIFVWHFLSSFRWCVAVKIVKYFQMYRRNITFSLSMHFSMWNIPTEVNIWCRHFFSSFHFIIYYEPFLVSKHLFIFCETLILRTHYAITTPLIRTHCDDEPTLRQHMIISLTLQNIFDTHFARPFSPTREKHFMGRYAVELRYRRAARPASVRSHRHYAHHIYFHYRFSRWLLRWDTCRRCT